MIKPTDRVALLTRLEDIGSNRDAATLLDKNERTVPYSEKVFQQLIETITPVELCKYPDQSPLYEALSKFLDLDKDYLLLTNGADSGLKLFFETQDRFLAFWGQNRPFWNVLV